MSRVSGPAQLAHDAGARESQGFKLCATGSLLDGRSAPVGPGVGCCLLSLVHFFRLAGQAISIPCHGFTFCKLMVHRSTYSIHCALLAGSLCLLLRRLVHSHWERVSFG